MAALEKIFEGYYANRVDGNKPDPAEMQVLNLKIMESLGYIGIKGSVQENIMEDVSAYGMYAEKAGFMAGFKMAWDLLHDMENIK